jgi:hypothetical protein
MDAVGAHHHHQSGSAGAQCVNCHMPTKAYMVVDIRRDHSLSTDRIRRRGSRRRPGDQQS